MLVPCQEQGLPMQFRLHDAQHLRERFWIVSLRLTHQRRDLLLGNLGQLQRSRLVSHSAYSANSLSRVPGIFSDQVDRPPRFLDKDRHFVEIAKLLFASEFEATIHSVQLHSAEFKC